VSAVRLTWLYVPGDQPERFGKALASGADAIIVDLEDAVAPARKDLARDCASRLLESPTTVPVLLRINGSGTPWASEDLAMAVRAPNLSGLRIPKVESRVQVDAISEDLGPRSRLELDALIESAAGVEAAHEIAQAPGVTGISLGEADLMSDLRLSEESGLAYARSRIVVAARAAGLPSPTMSVYTMLDDDEGLAESSAAGRKLGFLGRAAIHPRQLPIIEAAFMPSPAEIEAAQSLLKAAADAIADGRGTAVTAGGRFVDRAMLEAAKFVVEVAARKG
jgi:citrate lyase subunit beta/citryl-CoA lyase